MLSSRLLVTVQIAGFLLALAILAFYPPVRGKMILIPLNDTAAAQVVPLALTGGAALIAAGPLRGSLIVSGERRRLAAAIAATGILMIAAPAAVCGATVDAKA